MSLVRGLSACSWRNKAVQELRGKLYYNFRNTRCYPEPEGLPAGPAPPRPFNASVSLSPRFAPPTMFQQLAGGVSMDRRYSAAELHRLRARERIDDNPRASSILQNLRAAGILRYRGCRAGSHKRRPIQVRTTLRSAGAAPSANEHHCPSAQSALTFGRQHTQRESLLIYPPRIQLTMDTASPQLQQDFPPVFVINIRSLAKPHARDQLSADMTAYNVGYALVTETFLKAAHADSLLDIDHYRLFRHDRKKRKGGGVAIYARDSYTSRIIDVPNNNYDRCELLWIHSTTAITEYIVGVLYHPPCSSLTYNASDLLDALESATDYFSTQHPNAHIVLGGDINSLSADDVLERTGLTPLVHAPTRGQNTLDQLFTSSPLFQHVRVVTPTAKTDHQAILAHSVPFPPSCKRHTTFTFRPHGTSLCARFLAAIQASPPTWPQPLADPQAAFDHFYSLTTSLLDTHFPTKTITCTSRDPIYTTPQIKALLRTKNRLMRAGRIQEAGEIANKVGKEIARQNAMELTKVAVENSHDLWSAVRRLTGKRKQQHSETRFSAEQLNSHFASVSSDPLSTVPQKKHTCTPRTNPCLSEQQVFYLLDRLKPSAPGPDGLPTWFLKLAAPVLASPLAVLFNLALSLGFTPSQWKQASITPIAKIPVPSLPSDFRPISLTPILSKLVEKHIVRHFIYPLLTEPSPAHCFSDQHAFRPGGSTTTAIIKLLHTTTSMLAANHSVSLILLDFSKAFDTVRHSTLLNKVASLPLPDNIYNYIHDFLQNRTHTTNYNHCTSTALQIQCSVVQGSALGPALFVINSSDLRPLHTGNSLDKYADDVWLLTPCSNAHTRQAEIDHISKWAEENNLRLNLDKCIEIVITSQHSRRNAVPIPELADIPRKDSATFLGVTITSNLSMTSHVSSLLTNCMQTLYAIRILKSHGLPQTGLHTVFRATILSKILYGAPAWWGFTTQQDKSRINAFLRKCQKFGYLPSTTNMEENIKPISAKLFKATTRNSDHLLHSLLPPLADHPHNLRSRGHNFALTSTRTNLEDKNFLNQMLYPQLQHR